MDNSIAIILVEPENPDNIGAIARAMKNMGLTDLRLVAPVAGWKTKGKKMAVSAYDLLLKAKKYTSTEKAVSDIHFLVGTTRRGGPRRGVFHEMDAVISKIKKTRHKQKIGLMFGKESKGLDNESLNYCDWVTTIPVNPQQPSINLAQAVMIFAFSLFDEEGGLPQLTPRRGQKGKKKVAPKKEEALLNKKELLLVLDIFEKAVLSLGFSEKSQKVPRIRETFYRIVKRNGLLQDEAQMMKGLSRRIQECMKKDG